MEVIYVCCFRSQEILMELTSTTFLEFAFPVPNYPFEGRTVYIGFLGPPVTACVAWAAIVFWQAGCNRIGPEPLTLS
ncbi:hypothetical protein BJY01DRAFT_222023 [Aspergillus pseudoustus]|uniref:Uncharacterized protein n=1 Tax=Aspergillus pseudoustus TaxID=1810923 RepID=A0ABR4J997_9EURO